MSAGRADDGSYAIDPAELFRVYEMKKPDDATDATGSDPSGAVQDATGVATPSNASSLHGATPTEHELAVRLAGAEAELKGLRDMVEELRRTRDKWEAQAERLALMAPVRDAPVAQAGSWWPFRKRA
jgi:hypothetical protein